MIDAEFDTGDVLLQDRCRPWYARTLFGLEQLLADSSRALLAELFTRVAIGEIAGIKQGQGQYYPLPSLAARKRLAGRS
jgi:methionyl-tRNA formyltransferase